MWAAKSVQGFFGLAHLLQDSYAPGHGGKPWGGLDLSSLNGLKDALAHAWSDRMPNSDIRRHIVIETRTLMERYDVHCGGCIRGIGK